ncbi:MAG: 30S ribosomal protein S19e [Candidatus Nanoarchaeia archaeon]
MSIYNKDTNKLIEKTAEELKNIPEIKAPIWAPFVKTCAGKQRPPAKKDWWYHRTASLLRKLYIAQGPIGVSKLRKKYGHRKHRGFKPEKAYTGSGNVIRKILQQLDKAGFSKQVEKGVHKGRIITPKGKSFLDKLAK